MPIEVILVFFGGIFGIGGIILAGQYLSRSRATGLPAAELKGLVEAIEALRDDVQRVQDEVVELSGRVEFTERLLERPKEGGAARPGE